MEEAHRSLRLINPESGEIADQAPETYAEALIEIQHYRDQLAGAENNVRSMRAQMANMKRELEGEVDRNHRLFPEVMALYRYWQQHCHHEQTTFTPEHMKVVLPRIKANGSSTCRKAIRGAEYDAFVTTRKNGSTHRHNDWFQIFHPQKFESFVTRAPDYTEPTESQAILIASSKEFALQLIERIEERAPLIKGEGDPVAISHLLIEINKLVVAWMKGPFVRSQPS